MVNTACMCVSLHVWPFSLTAMCSPSAVKSKGHHITVVGIVLILQGVDNEA